MLTAERGLHARIVPASADLQARWKSLASFLYCSRLGWGGRESGRTGYRNLFFSACLESAGIRLKEAS